MKKFGISLTAGCYQFATAKDICETIDHAKDSVGIYQTSDLVLIFESMRVAIFEIKNEVFRREKSKKSESNNG